MGRILTISEALSIQKALNANGSHLDEDGHFGALTQAALIAYQTNKGIVPADGNPSLATTQALGIAPIETPIPPKPTSFHLDLSTILALLPLLKGTPMTADQITGIIRAILTAAGGYFVARGTIDQGTATAVVGAAVTIVAAIWSLWSNRPKTIVPLAAK